jgi:hypothetical protein
MDLTNQRVVEVFINRRLAAEKASGSPVVVGFVPGYAIATATDGSGRNYSVRFVDGRLTLDPYRNTYTRQM